jgi:CheY-like chemotaxis protein
MLARPCKDILVVEDDEDTRELLQALLEAEGYVVRTAVNGQDALTALRHITPPQLILLDLMMPVMNGWQFRRQQLRDRRLASIPVLVLSAVQDAQEQASALNVTGFFQKPFDLDALVRTVNDVVARPALR